MFGKTVRKTCQAAPWRLPSCISANAPVALEETGTL